MSASFECIMRLNPEEVQQLEMIIDTAVRCLKLSARENGHLLLYGDDPFIPLDRVSKLPSYDGHLSIQKVIGRFSLTDFYEAVEADISIEILPRRHLVVFSLDENIVFGKPSSEPEYGNSLITFLFDGWRCFSEAEPVQLVRYGTEGGPVEDLLPEDFQKFWLPAPALSQNSAHTTFDVYWNR